MKLIFDNEDEVIMEKINTGKIPSNRLLYNKKDQEYSLNFKITDIAKANNFLFTLFDMTGTPSEETKDLISATGIKITSCNYFSAKTDFNRNELKEQLQRIVDSL